MAPVTAPKPLPALLLEQGLLTADQLQAAQALVAASGLSLRRVLVQQQLVPEEQLAALVAAQAGLAHVDLSTQQIRPEVLALVPAEFARQHAILPVFRIEETLTIAMADPLNIFIVDELRLLTRCDIKRVVASEAGIRQTIARCYAAQASSAAAPPEPGDASSPAIKALDALLREAIKRQAPRLILEPAPEGLRVSWETAGVAHRGAPLSAGLHGPLLSRLKVLARLDITAHAKPQQGSCRLQLDGHVLSLQVAVRPGPSGESMHLAWEDAKHPVPGLDDLGMEAATAAALRAALRQPRGLLLVSCPAAGALTATLAALSAAAAAAGIPATGVEVDSAPALQQARDAAQRGLVLCGFKAAGLRAALPRAEALLGVLYQVPVQRVCRLCALPEAPPAALRARLQIAEGIMIARAQGCPACCGTGYCGERGLFIWAPGPQDAAADPVLWARAAAEALRAQATTAEELGRALPALFSPERT